MTSSSLPNKSRASNAQELQKRLDANPEKRLLVILEFNAERVAAEDREGAEYAILFTRLELEKENARLKYESEVARLEHETEKAKLENEKMKLKEDNRQVPKWLLPVGIGFGFLTFLFLGAIVLLAIAGYVIPPAGKFALVAMLAFGAAFSAAAWIGTATLSGNIATDSQKPLVLSASGGFAVFALVFFLGYWFYIK